MRLPLITVPTRTLPAHTVLVAGHARCRHRLGQGQLVAHSRLHSHDAVKQEGQNKQDAQGRVSMDHGAILRNRRFDRKCIAVACYDPGISDNGIRPCLTTLTP